MTAQDRTAATERVSKLRRSYAVIDEIETELLEAMQRFDSFNSGHEGWAVIREEVDELWDLVKQNSSASMARAEAIQIAAMAIRYVIEVCDA